jgi:hypothetical protein
MFFYIFIFKRRYRNFFLNNFIKNKKIKNTFIINLSGPFLSLIGYLLYLLINKKKIVFISCDGIPFLYKEYNSINLWMGGTSKKIPMEYRNFKNNYVTSSNISTNRKIVLQVYPEQVNFNNLNNNIKFIYASTFVKPKSNISLNIWKKYKLKIMQNTTCINQIKFWGIMKKINRDDISELYIDLKNLIRFEYICALQKKFKDRLILIGSDWINYYSNAQKNNFSNKYLIMQYKGNVGLDFGSRDGEEVFYPRSNQIIESGALLIQSKQSYLNNNEFKNIYNKISFKNCNELISLCDKIIKYPRYGNLILERFVSFFNKKHYNSINLKKILYQQSN